jgi:GNAT superfamily N-acetyltransferase
MTQSLVKAEILPLQNISDIGPVAHDLREGMLDRSNNDLLGDFPSMVTEFAISKTDGLEELSEMQDSCIPGTKELFVAFSGATAVGLSGVEKVSFPVQEVSPEWPMLWGFVHNPWRRQGIGALMTQARLDAVTNHFGGKAWAMVRTDNRPSMKNMQKAGFKMTSLTEEDHPQGIFVYDAHALKEPATY